MDDREEPNENLLVAYLSQLLKSAQTSAEHDVLCAWLASGQPYGKIKSCIETRCDQILESGDRRIPLG